MSGIKDALKAQIGVGGTGRGGSQDMKIHHHAFNWNSSERGETGRWNVQTAAGDG